MFRQLLLLLLSAFIFHHGANCFPSNTSIPNPDHGEPGERTSPPSSLPVTSSCKGCSSSGSPDGSLPFPVSSVVTSTPSKPNSSFGSSPVLYSNASSVGSNQQTVHTSAEYLSSPAPNRTNTTISTTLPTQQHTVGTASQASAISASVGTTSKTTTGNTTMNTVTSTSHSSPISNVKSTPTLNTTSATAVPTAVSTFTTHNTSRDLDHTTDISKPTSQLPVETTAISTSSVATAETSRHHHSSTATVTVSTHRTILTTNFRTTQQVTSGSQSSINGSAALGPMTSPCQNGSCGMKSSKSNGLKIVIPVVSASVGLIIVGIVVRYVFKAKRLRLRRLQLVPLYAFEQEDGDDELLASQSDEDDEDEESNSTDHRQVTLNTHHGMPQLVFDT